MILMGLSAVTPNSTEFSARKREIKILRWTRQEELTCSTALFEHLSISNVQ
jgi:hypothetical protein